MISVIYPTMGRINLCYSNMIKWIGQTIYPDVEWIISIDHSEKDNTEYYELSKLNNVGIVVNESGTAIAAINKAAMYATGKYLVVISDDFELFWGWDAELWKCMQGKSDFCAKTNDGHQDWLITLPIMDRTYYERFGYVYNPIYGHMFADLEMTSVAWMLARYIELPLTFKHNHYSVIGEKPDAINRKNNATWGQGQMMFKKRLSQNFGVDPVQGLPDLKKHFV